MIGTRVSHYHVLEKIGGGSLGEVFRAEDTKHGRLAALKFLHRDSIQDQQAFQQCVEDIRVVSALGHPSTCPVYEVGRFEGRHCVAMRFLEGETLKQRLARGRLGTREVLRLGARVIDGLDTAHRQSVVHGDIRPAKIFLTVDGQVQILDFGLGRLRPKQAAVNVDDTSAPQAAAAMDLAYYTSPEQGLGEELDGRSDIFSLGVVLYQMATGVLPFSGETPKAVFNAVLHQPPVPPREHNPEVSEELERIIATALAKYRELGYRSAAELRDDLSQLLEEKETSFSSPAVVRGETAIVTVGGESADSSDRAVKREKEEEAASPRQKALDWRMASVLVGVFILVAAGSFFYWGWSDILSEDDKVLLMEVANGTDESVFDGTLRAGLAVKLRESPFLNLVPDRDVRETLAGLSSQGGGDWPSGMMDQVCQRHSAKAVLQGSIRKDNGDYRIRLEAVRCGRGYPLASAEAEAAGRDSVLEALGVAASQLRRRLGESGRSLERHDTPITQATSSSLQALQSFGQGLTQQEEGNDREAIGAFQDAIRYDPGFALAQAKLGLAYDRLGDSAQALQYRRAAFSLRERANELDRLMISAAYHEHVSGNLQDAEDVYQRWRVLYPRDWRPRSRQAHLHVTRGEFQRAVEEAREALRRGANQAPPYITLARAYLGLGDFGEAKTVCQQMLADGAESVDTNIILYWIAFVEGDQDAMARQAALAKELPGESLVLAVQAEAAAFSGRLRRARDLYEQAAELASRRGFNERAASLAALGALTDAEVGFYRLAQTKAVRAVGRGNSVRAPAVLALARSGEVRRSQLLVDELARRSPEDTVLQAVALPTIRAHIKVHEGQPVAALDLLQAARPYELGVTPEFPSFASLYVRGQAYLLAGRAAEAADEFQRILDHRGLDPVSPFYALAHLRLARAYSLAGNTDGQKRAYQDFLALWKDADPDIPLLQEAKAEYNKLQE